MKKQTRIILGVTVLVITILLVKNILFDKSIKEQIFEIVNDNAQTILADIEELNFADSMSIEEI